MSNTSTYVFQNIGNYSDISVEVYSDGAIIIEYSENGEYFRSFDSFSSEWVAKAAIKGSTSEDIKSLIGLGEKDRERVTKKQGMTAVIKKEFTNEFKKPACDAVKSPKHYQIFEGVESIKVIASSLTRDEWRGFCLGNILKYRIRAGKKDALEQDIAKANEYENIFEKHKRLNKP